MCVVMSYGLNVGLSRKSRKRELKCPKPMYAVWNDE